MLRVEEALERVLAGGPAVVPEEVPLEAAYGRVLAEDVVSGVLLPPWDNAAMDGYAVWAADFAEGGQAGSCDGPGADGATRALVVLETIAAGRPGARVVLPGTTSRIMTGAPLPAGADAVVMRENSAPLPASDGGEEQVALRGPVRAGQHVRRAGEEVRPGDVLLRAGHTLNPMAVGLCASLGRARVVVARRPRVAILATGDEVVTPGLPLQPGQIWSSNTPSLVGLVLEAGGLPVDCGIAPDDVGATRAALQRGLACDLMVSTGGVSVGDYDVVKTVLEEEGARLDFWKVRMKPGKPLAFGSYAGRPYFGLPGNPVSCVVNFLQFVRPVLRRALGDPRPFLPVVDAVAERPISGGVGREELVRVTLRWDGPRLLAQPTGAQGSGLLTSLVRGHGFALLAANRPPVQAGEQIAVQIYDPEFGCGAEPGYRW